MGYSTEMDKDTTAKAYGRELPISPKKAREVCSTLRGMRTEEAKELLEQVVAKRRAIPYRRYKTFVAHRPGMAGGGYPVKVAKQLLRLLQSAQDNAEYQGLDAENTRIAHISAYRGQPIQGFMQRAHGRSTQWNQDTTNIEIILQEVEE